MEQPDIMPLNVNRTASDAPIMDAPATSAIPAATPTLPGRPDTSITVDLKKVWPWIVGILVLLFLVWLLTRRRGGGVSA